MNKTFQKIATPLVIGIALLMIPISVLAVGAGAERKEIIVEAQCAVINNRIDRRIDHFAARKDAHIRAYQNAVARAEKFADRFDEDGLNTTQLRADTTVLKDKVKTAGTTYASFIDTLEEAKQYNCGDSQGKFKSTMEEARTLLRTFRTQITDARTYFKDVVKVDIKALQDQKKSK